MKTLKNALWALAGIIAITTLAPLFYDIVSAQDVSVLITQLEGLGYHSWAIAGGDVTFTGDILPNVADTQDIGDPTAEWNDVYVGSTGKVYLGTDQARYIDATHPATRTATLVVAASDAPVWVKAQADYLCDGVADQTEINAVISADRKVVLSVGTFTTTATININVNNFWLEGEGSGTKIVATGDYPAITIAGTGIANISHPHISNMQIWGFDNTGASTNADGIRVTWDHTGTYENLYIYNCYIGIHCQRSWQSNYENVKVNGGAVGDKCYYGFYAERQSTSHNYVTVTDSIFANTLNSPVVIRDAAGSTFSKVNAEGNAAGHAWDIGNSDADSVVTWLILTDCLADTTPAGNYDGFHIEKGATGAFFSIRINNIWAGTIQGRYAVDAIGVEDLQLLGGTITTVAKHAIVLSGVTYFKIDDLHITGYGATNYDGINSATSERGSVTGCTFNSVGSRRGITKDGSGAWHILANYVEVSGGDASLISGLTAFDICRSNFGYKTENSGTATVLSGQTHVHVTHGLAAAPTRVQITPKENPTNAVSYYWVDTVGAAEFIINVNADPGASNLDFDWRAVIGEGN